MFLQMLQFHFPAIASFLAVFNVELQASLSEFAINLFGVPCYTMCR